MIFFKEKTTGPLGGAALKLDSSTGTAYPLGLDWKWSDKLTLNFDVRKWNIHTTAHVSDVGRSSLSSILQDRLDLDRKSVV